MKLLTKEDSPKHVLLKGITSIAHENCLITLVDITDIKIAEAELKVYFNSINKPTEKEPRVNPAQGSG